MNVLSCWPGMLQRKTAPHGAAFFRRHCRSKAAPILHRIFVDPRGRLLRQQPISETKAGASGTNSNRPAPMRHLALIVALTSGLLVCAIWQHM
jgi:hypothetical protein